MGAEMGAKSGIEWTDATWNPSTGCTKVSAGCKHCYAERDWPRLVHLPAYHRRAFTDVACHPERLIQPLRWKRPRRIFVNSMSDLFHEDVPDDFIDKVFAVMAMSPQHTFQVLTKRPERMRDYLCQLMPDKAGRRWYEAVRGEFRYKGSTGQLGPEDTIGTRTSPALPNVWLGVSVEDQAAVDQRIPLLLQTPAAVRWVSAEPLLGPVSLVVPFDGARVDAAKGARPGIPWLDWVVVGGESGPKARPMHPDWARSLRDQCAAAGVPFLFKQWGEWLPVGNDPTAVQSEASRSGPAVLCRTLSSDGETAVRIGKKAAGRLLDGELHDGYPEVAK